MKNYNLTIGWLYPDLMSTYGDRGNIIVMQKRAEWRDISVSVKKITVGSTPDEIKTCDILFMGGAQDRQQEIVTKDLQAGKGDELIKALESEVPALFICGAYQFLGKYYKAADGTKIPGLGFFDLYTENPGEQFPRLIGNLVVKPKIKEMSAFSLVGFENHGGRTYLSDNKYAFATVENGFGNNGEDKTEGIFYKNAIGTYLHGPILSKNPELADFIITKALEKKYNEKVNLRSLQNILEEKAKQILKERITG